MLLDFYGPLDILLSAILNRVELLNVVDDSNCWVWDVDYIAFLFGAVFEHIEALSYNTY